MVRICSLPVLILWLALIAAPAFADLRGSARIIDGDTIEVSGTTVRLFGIDAPEVTQPCPSAQGPWACGPWAREMLSQIAVGPIRCEARDTDRYGRLVAVCTSRHGDLGAAMVEAGAAMAFRRYSMDYVAHEARAEAARRGLWRGGADGMTDPAEFRAEQRMRQASADGAPPNGCAIKGNISANGRIYHRPGQRDYARTRINTSAGERWFCSESEARAAGWRPAAR